MNDNKKTKRKKLKPINKKDNKQQEQQNKIKIVDQKSAGIANDAFVKYNEVVNKLLDDYRKALALVNTSWQLNDIKGYQYYFKTLDDLLLKMFVNNEDVNIPKNNEEKTKIKNITKVVTKEVPVKQTTFTNLQSKKEARFSFKSKVKTDMKDADMQTDKQVQVKKNEINDISDKIKHIIENVEAWFDISMFDRCFNLEFQREYKFVGNKINCKTLQDYKDFADIYFYLSHLGYNERYNKEHKKDNERYNNWHQQNNALYKGNGFIELCKKIYHVNDIDKLKDNVRNNIKTIVNLMNGISSDKKKEIKLLEFATIDPKKLAADNKMVEKAKNLNKLGDAVENFLKGKNDGNKNKKHDLVLPLIGSKTLNNGYSNSKIPNKKKAKENKPLKIF